VESEGQFFIDVMRADGKESVLDAATGTGFQLAGYSRTSIIASAQAMCPSKPSDSAIAR
jgi:hypothetical protein